MMGGSINVQSQFGHGSIFMVQIPQKISKLISELENIRINEDVSNLNKIKEISNSIAIYNGKRILIVDDNKLNIKVARRVLQDFNFIIDEAYDGASCIDKVNEGYNYDLILMDIMMPNMSGETALAKLKENPNFNIPTIALTADAVAGAEEKYINEGFIDYLTKPFTKEQIKEKLDIVFNNKDKVELKKDNYKDVATYIYDASKDNNDINII